MTLSPDQVAILKILFKAKPKYRKILLENADKNLVKGLCECVLNILLGNIHISAEQKKKFSKHKSYLRELVKKGGDWKKKRKVLQKGGNFLIPLLIPIITTLISKLF
jgi:hypothetical protein